MSLASKAVKAWIRQCPYTGYYIITPTISDWHSEPYPSREAAQEWIDAYRVSPSFKDNYKIVAVEEYWARRAAVAKEQTA